VDESLEDLAASQTITHPCPICSMEAQRQVIGPQTYMFYCPRCGTFAGGSATWLKVETPDHMVRLSGWVREQNAAGGHPMITAETSRRLAQMRLPGLRERAGRALQFISEKILEIDRWYPIDGIAAEAELLGRTYSIEPAAAGVLLRLLIEERLLDEASSGGMVHISIRGLLAVEELGATGGQPQGFVAMWFDAALSDAWINGFDPAIRAAGYVPMRIDNKEYLGGISDEIIAEIRRSRFVVVDYTGQRNNVYFEAGFALGLGLPIIPTCRADEATNLGFDIRHMNTLTWSSPEDLAIKLNNRIQAVIGAGPALKE